DRSSLRASLVADFPMVSDPDAAFGLASGGRERSRGIPSASEPAAGLDRARDGSWQWDAHLSRRRDGFARSRRLLARGPRWNSIRRRDGAVPARAQSVRADFLHRLSDTEDRLVPRFHLYIRHLNAFEDRIHLSRMPLSDRGDVLLRLSRGADAADLERAKLRRKPIHNSAAGHFAGDDAQHFFGAAGRTAGGDHRGGYHRNDRGF